MHYRRHAGRFFKRAAIGAAAAIGTRFKFRKLGGGSLTKTKRRGRQVTGTTTFQNDQKMLYNRRRAPRRVRSRARKQFQRFSYNIDRVSGMKTFHVSYITSVATSPSVAGSPAGNCQGVDAFTMYGTNQSILNTDHASDLWKIYLAENGVVPTSTLANGHLRFRSVTMDYLVKNTGEDAIYIEIYYVQCRRSGITSDPAAAWNAMLQEEQTLPGAVTTEFTVSGYKITPFDAPGFGSYWYVKQRKRFYVEPGNTVSWQVRDAKNYLITGNQIFTSKGLPGITEGCIIVGYGADVQPLTTPAGNGIPTAATYDIGCVTTYHYAKADSNNDQTGTYVS